MNGEGILVGLIVGGAVVFAVWSVWKSFGEGESGGACPNCDAGKRKNAK